MGGGPEKPQQQTLEPDMFHVEPWYSPDHLMHHLPWASIAMIAVALFSYLGIRAKNRRKRR